MYSRNFSTDIGGTAVRLNTNARNDRGKAINGNIPVKSFTDNFAYERFNKMGYNKPIEEHSEPASVNTESDTVNISANTEETLPIASMESEKQISKPEERISEIGILTRLKNTFDSDTLLIILAAIMLMFSDNATNDKLTPLALLAILFL